MGARAARRADGIGPGGRRSDESERRAETRGTDAAPIEILDVDWNIDEVDNYTILGKIRDNTDIPVANVKISVNFFTKDGELVETKSTVVSGSQPFKRGQQYSFSIRGNSDKEFNFFTTQVESWWE
ncbi:MAG: FxLYD domain-containing protein [Deltaproteobacteria bacterium]|nr:FxLYD domain-containing protein [Deltaproteobacteria bacterium]